MNKLFETAKEIDRILKSGIEIHPNSPIHEKLQQALNIPLVVRRSEQLCVDCKTRTAKIGNQCISCNHGWTKK